MPGRAGSFIDGKLIGRVRVQFLKTPLYQWFNGRLAGAGCWEKRALFSISNAETAQLRHQNRPESHWNRNLGNFTFRDEFAVDSLLQRRVSCKPEFSSRHPIDDRRPRQLRW